MNRGLIRMACGTGFVLAMVLAGCGGGSVPAPKTYKVWNATDGTFSIQYPEDWNAKGGGKHGIQWAEFSKGSAKIRIDVSTQTSLIGDISQSFNTMAGVNDPFSEVPDDVKESLAPVAAAHNYYQEVFPVTLRNYKEKEPVPFESRLGDCRKSEFTARSGISTRLRGYRATALTLNKGVHILCQCTDGNWKTLQPAFDQMLSSLSHGAAP